MNLLTQSFSKHRLHLLNDFHLFSIESTTNDIIDMMHFNPNNNEYILNASINIITVIIIIYLAKH